MFFFFFFFNEICHVPPLSPLFPASTFLFTPAADDTNIYEAYRAKRELIFSPAAALQAEETPPETPTASKEDYLQREKEAGEKRKNERQMAAWRK